MGSNYRQGRFPYGAGTLPQAEKLFFSEEFERGVGNSTLFPNVGFQNMPARWSPWRVRSPAPPGGPSPTNNVDTKRHAAMSLIAEPGVGDIADWAGFVTPFTGRPSALTDHAFEIYSRVGFIRTPTLDTAFNADFLDSYCGIVLSAGNLLTDPNEPFIAAGLQLRFPKAEGECLETVPMVGKWIDPNDDPADLISAVCGCCPSSAWIRAAVAYSEGDDETSVRMDVSGDNGWTWSPISSTAQLMNGPVITIGFGGTGWREAGGENQQALTIVDSIRAFDVTAENGVLTAFGTTGGNNYP